MKKYLKDTVIILGKIFTKYEERETDKCISIPEPKGKVDIFLSPLGSSKHESRSLRSKILLQLLVVLLRICQQVATKLRNTITSIRTEQNVNPSEVSRKDTEMGIFGKVLVM